MVYTEPIEQFNEANREELKQGKGAMRQSETERERIEFDQKKEVMRWGIREGFIAERDQRVNIPRTDKLNN